MLSVTKQSISTLAALLVAVTCLDTSSPVSKDVIIIGGGAGGAHAAVQLKDMGQDIILIEKQGTLVI